MVTLRDPDKPTKTEEIEHTEHAKEKIFSAFGQHKESMFVDTWTLQQGKCKHNWKTTQISKQRPKEIHL